MNVQPARQRRSLKYIRLAAFLAGQVATVDRIEMTAEEIEGLVGEKLPPGAKFPSWWRNDARKMHARAWLTAGWEVDGFDPGGEGVVFVRRSAP